MFLSDAGVEIPAALHGPATMTTSETSIFVTLAGLGFSPVPTSSITTRPRLPIRTTARHGFALALTVHRALTTESRSRIERVKRFLASTRNEYFPSHATYAANDSYSNQSPNSARNSRRLSFAPRTSGCHSGCIRGDPTWPSQPRRVSLNTFRHPGIGQR